MQTLKICLSNHWSVEHSLDSRQCFLPKLPKKGAPGKQTPVGKHGHQCILEQPQRSRKNGKLILHGAESEANKATRSPVRLVDKSTTNESPEQGVFHESCANSPRPIQANGFAAHGSAT